MNGGSIPSRGSKIMNTLLKTFKPNTAGRDFVVGDLHGCYKLLLAALKHVEFDENVDRLFSVGDLVDRGKENEDCLALLDKAWFHCVKGNHEQLMEDYLTGGPTGVYWDYNGGGWWRDNKYTALDVENLLFKLKNMPFGITVENSFHVIHAELHNDPKLSELNFAEKFESLALRRMGDGEAVLWGREKFMMFYGADLSKLKTKNSGTSKLFPIFSGHTTVRNPLTIGNQTCIDTGAFRAPRDKWAGLTIVEPATNTFWKTNYFGTEKVQPVIL